MLLKVFCMNYCCNKALAITEPFHVFLSIFHLSSHQVKGKSKMIVWYYHATYAFQSESTRYSCLNGIPCSSHTRYLSVSNSNGIRTYDHLVCERTLNHLTKPNWPNDWAVLWVLIYTVHLTVCYYDVMHAFQSESTLYSSLNVKELLDRNSHNIWSLSENNRI